MNKPTKPNITIPESFAKNGIKTDFDSDLMTEGFDSLKPDVLAGDNLNKFIDDTYKGLNYGMAAADAINLIQEGETLTVQNGQLVSGSTGGGLELCDIGMALYVDETKGLRRYLNGQIVDINTNTQAFLNRLLQIKTTNPEYFATEENWQAEALLNIDGCVYKFVLNYSGETVVSVRLPKYPDYVEINAGGTLPVVGNGATLGLSNGTVGLGLITQGDIYKGNAYYSTTAFNKAVGSNATWDYGNLNSNKNIGVTTDATKSGIQTTLKQTKLKMRYFIQIATGSETEANIVNTLENVNGFTLLESKYSDKPLYNESWLLSNGQENAKAVYPTVYEGLQVEYNTEIEVGTTVTLPSGVSYTKRGLSVKLSTETYTDYDFRLNPADETFRLPLKNHTADDGNSVLTLYFYVGETVQNANLIDAGRIGEQLATKTDMLQASGASMPSNKYINLTLGASGSSYTAPANGWFTCYKWGLTAAGYLYMRNNANGLIMETRSTINGTAVSAYVPVQKGQSILVNYDAVGTTIFRFIYAEGSK